MAITEVIEWTEDWDGSRHIVVGSVIRKSDLMLVVLDGYGFEHYIYRWEITDRRKLYG